ncbi:hypothetical protein C8J57DRAFT_1212534 [Mycena rebaudengoi]|nr:hypothetical protein C8J57DRAFT_1212534 [Mycena rebaudengoi]
MSTLSTQSNRVRVMGIYTCPPHLSAEEYMLKMEGLCNTIRALPEVEKNVTKYEVAFSVENYNPHINNIGLPTTEPGTTAVVTVETRTEAEMAKAMGDPDVVKVLCDAIDHLGLGGKARVVKFIEKEVQLDL